MLKEKIQKEVNTYEIQTTSDSILNKFHSQNKVKKHSNLKPLLAYSLSFLLIATVSSVLIIDGINNNSSSTIPSQKLFSNIISLEVTSSLNIIENYNSPTLTILRKQNIDENSFIDISQNFASNYSTLEKGLTYKDNIPSNTSEGEFIVNDITYTYKVEIDDNKNLYYNSYIKEDTNLTKETYSGILLIDNNSYEMKGERKTNSNNNKDEIDLRITLDSTSTLLIEQETERSDYSYSYSIIENNKEIFELELDFEKDEIEMECFKDNKEYEYEIQKNKDSIYVEYEYQNNKTSFEGNFTVTFNENNTQMIFEDKKNSLFYTIYQ